MKGQYLVVNQAQLRGVNNWNIIFAVNKNKHSAKGNMFDDIKLNLFKVRKY